MDHLAPTARARPPAGRIAIFSRAGKPGAVNLLLAPAPLPNPRARQGGAKRPPRYGLGKAQRWAAPWAGPVEAPKLHCTPRMTPRGRVHCTGARGFALLKWLPGRGLRMRFGFQTLHPGGLARSPGMRPHVHNLNPLATLPISSAEFRRPRLQFKFTCTCY